MMTAAEALRAAKAKIEDPGYWCKYYYARDADGKPTESFDQKACSWCALGAVLSIGADFHIFHYLHKAAKEYGCISADVLNDHSTHAQVMKMYDRAIELAEEDKVT